MGSRSWWWWRRLWSRKWRECCKRDREEEVVLAAMREEVLSESRRANTACTAIIVLRDFLQPMCSASPLFVTSVTKSGLRSECRGEG
jgi:hypothetical protein